MDAAAPGYFRTVCEYVHLNPVRAKLLTPEQALRDYVWSSYPEYLKPPTRHWPWLRVERLLGEMRLPKDSAAGRRQFERQESGEAKAERLVREGLRKLRWKDAELAERRNGDPGKVRIAQRLRRETTMTLAWIAQRLQMGVWTHVSNLLRAGKSKASSVYPGAIYHVLNRPDHRSRCRGSPPHLRS